VEFPQLQLATPSPHEQAVRLGSAPNTTTGIAQLVGPLKGCGSLQACGWRPQAAGASRLWGGHNEACDLHGGLAGVCECVCRNDTHTRAVQIADYHVNVGPHALAAIMYGRSEIAHRVQVKEVRRLQPPWRSLKARLAAQQDDGSVLLQPSCCMADWL
jgi:hypothetical protein